MYRIAASSAAFLGSLARGGGQVLQEDERSLTDEV